MSSDRMGTTAVVGAGPYGLAAAIYLQAAGLPVHVIGEPLSYWRDHMPDGMRLRSSWRASSIASPADRLSLAAFERDRGRQVARPVPLTDFVEYGSWYQRRAEITSDQRRVTRIEAASHGFAVTFATGEPIQASRVVLACGLENFARRPKPFADLPSSLVSHIADHLELQTFAGRDLVVIGAGQSAIESAVLAYEAGAHVRVIMRAPEVHWLTRSAHLHEGMGQALYAPTDVGPAGLSWLVANPELMRRLPCGPRQALSRRCLRPAASDWLAPRAEGITLMPGLEARSATVLDAGGVRLGLSDGATIDADHVLLGTGFAPQLASVSILAPELLHAVALEAGQPILGAGFETSVPGLHVLGALAAYSYGAVMRFISGTWYAAPALARHIARSYPQRRLAGPFRLRSRSRNEPQPGS